MRRATLTVELLCWMAMAALACTGCQHPRPPAPSVAGPVTPPGQGGPPTSAADTPGLALAWRAEPGSWHGVGAVGADGLRATRGTELVAVDATGQCTDLCPVPDERLWPLAAELTGSGGSETVLWGQSQGVCVAVDAAGNVLWRETGGSTVAQPGAAVADLDRDGRDEVIAAGDGCVSLLAADGAVRWRTALPWPVTSVAARTDPAGEARIMACAGSELYVLDPAGAVCMQARPTHPVASEVAPVAGLGRQQACMAVYGVTADAGAVVGLDAVGRELWRLGLDADGLLGPQVLRSHPTRPYVAVGYGSGDLVVVSALDGALVGRLGAGRLIGTAVDDAAWLESDAGTLLVASGWGVLAAYEFHPR